MFTAPFEERLREFLWLIRITNADNDKILEKVSAFERRLNYQFLQIMSSSIYLLSDGTNVTAGAAYYLGDAQENVNKPLSNYPFPCSWIVCISNHPFGLHQNRIFISIFILFLASESTSSMIS